MARPVAYPPAGPPAWAVTSLPVHEGGGFFAQASRFDGANDYLTRGSDLTGNADGKEGTLSFWLKLNGGDGVAQDILAALDPSLEIGKNSANATVLNLQTSAAYTASGGWIHFLASWSLGVSGARHIYVNDAADLSVVNFTDDIIEYTRADWSVGGAPGGTRLLNACLAELWFARAYVDISVEATRRKFTSASGKPLDLGANGASPTGSQPILYFREAFATFGANKGSGGAFTANGALAACASSPSD